MPAPPPAPSDPERSPPRPPTTEPLTTEPLTTEPPTADLPSVAVLIVSHDGARWLPQVLGALGAQDAVPARVVAVDTGSTDGSLELLEEALGGPRLSGEVVRENVRTTFPDAVRCGLERLDATAERSDWLWVLHDDAAPAPDALARLLEAAGARPDAALLGPKLREWPSLRRLLELGVTITGTGQRETGLERGEYDQGQHDEVREVLAVNSAGMLVRRAVLDELGGFDPALPVFGNDVDLGWRAAAAGHATLVVPDAVVFHAEAAHRGNRRTPLTGRHTHLEERRAALYTLLANAPTAHLPLMVVRLVLGTLLRALGFLLVRSVGEAVDDLAALGSVLARPRELREARRARRRARGEQPPDSARVRRLRAPFWLPYRHGLDAVGDLVAALGDQAADVAERRRLAAADLDPSSMAARRVAAEDREGEDGERVGEDGALVRILTNPVALGIVAVVVALLVATRAAVGSVSGGALSPAPEAVAAWWSLHLDTYLPLGQGTEIPAPADVLVLALLGTVLSPGGAVSVVLLLSAPLALWGGWRFLRVAGRLADARGLSRNLLLAGATTFALVPLTSGAWGQGRLGPVVAGALLPWLAYACLALADPDPDRRWRAGWRAGLLLALVSAFAPIAWFVAVVAGLLGLGLAALRNPGLVRRRNGWGPPATALATVPVLLAPWWVPLLAQGAGVGLLLEAGRPVVDGVQEAPGLGLLLGRLGDPGELGAPTWLGVLLLAAGAAALLPRRSRAGVLGCWLVAMAAAVTAYAVSLVPLELAGLPVAPGLGAVVVIWQGCLVTAAVLGAQAATLRRGADPGTEGTGDTQRRAPVLLVGILLIAAAVPLGGLVWSVVDGAEELGEPAASDIPAYMQQSATAGPEHGILVLRGGVETGLSYAVVRDDGVTTGEDEVLALSPEDDDLTRDVTALVSRPTSGTVGALGEAGVEYVVLPTPVDGRVASGLDATPGLVQASTDDRATRAWQVDRPLAAEALAGSGAWWRPVLLALQPVAILLALVLAAPTTRARRRQR